MHLHMKTKFAKLLFWSTYSIWFHSISFLTIPQLSVGRRNAAGAGRRANISAGVFSLSPYNTTTRCKDANDYNRLENNSEQQSPTHDVVSALRTSDSNQTATADLQSSDLETRNTNNNSKNTSIKNPLVTGAGNNFSNIAYEQIDPNQLILPYSVYDDTDVDLLT